MTAPEPRRRFNPVLWLVIGIPAATVVAGIWTLMLAAGDGATDSHPDEVRRMAQVQEASFDADAVAAREGLSARVQVGTDQVLVIVEPTAGTRAPALVLRHPIQASLDQALPLSPYPGGWRATKSMAATHGWHLQLIASDGRWRLVGRYQPGDTEVVLLPSLASP
jgi:uncharacterized protein